MFFTKNHWQDFKLLDTADKLCINPGKGLTLKLDLKEASWEGLQQKRTKEQESR